MPRMDPLIRSTTLARANKRWRGDRMRRRLPPSARPSVMSAAIFESGSKATTTPVAPAVPRVFGFPMQAEHSIIVDPKSPGGINSPHGLILFDGVCVLCSRRLPLREQT